MKKKIQHTHISDRCSQKRFNESYVQSISSLLCWILPLFFISFQFGLFFGSYSFIIAIEIFRLCCFLFSLNRITCAECWMLMLVLYEIALSLKTNKIFTFAFYLYWRAFSFQSQMLCAHSVHTKTKRKLGSFHKTPKNRTISIFFFFDFHSPLFDRLFSLSCFINLRRRYISNGPLLVARFFFLHLLCITWNDFLTCTKTQKIHYSFMGMNWSEK